jgi:sn-glycerol 3-phosphate transport system substrate-binding protein
MKRGVKVLIILFLLTSTTIALSNPIVIHFWHAMSGKRLGAVQAIVDGFNKTHPNIKVVPLFTGTYAETLTKAIAAYRAGNPPDIVQVYEVGFQTMLDSGAIVPASDILKGFNFGNIVGPILRYYSYKGKLYSMPFNSSTAMLYYNKDVFKKAGLDPEKPPTTFEELYEDGLKIVQSGAAQAGITFGWPAWIFEQMFAYHDQLYANNDNGRGEKKATQLNINGPFGVKVMSEWMKWNHNKVLLYGGREYSANQAFLSGQSAMLIQSTSSLKSIESAASFKVGTGFLPKMSGYQTGNSVIGGATIWTMKGLSQEKYKAIAEFLAYIAKTDVTIQWHNSTGYFPITNAAVKELLDTGSFCEDPNSLTAFLQILTGNVKDPAAIGVRLGGFVQIRDVVDSAIESAMQYKGTDYAQEAKKILDNAENQANKILSNYVKMYGLYNK